MFIFFSFDLGLSFFCLGYQPFSKGVLVFLKETGVQLGGPSGTRGGFSSHLMGATGCWNWEIVIEGDGGRV